MRLTASWACPSTLRTEASEQAAIGVILHPKLGQVSGTEFENFLTTLALQYPELDFYRCAHQTILNGLATIDDWCKVHGGQPNCFNRHFYDEYKRQTYTSLAQYEEAAYARGAEDPFEPGAVSIPPIPEYIQKSMISYLRNQCALYGLNVEYTDGGFLPKIANGLRGASADCKLSVAAQYARLLSEEMTIPEEKCTGEARGRCEARMDAIAKTLLWLHGAGLTPYLFDEDIEMLIKGGYENSKGLVARLRNSGRVIDLPACRNLKESEEEVIYEDTGTGLPAYYTLLRTSDQTLLEDYRALSTSIIKKGSQVSAYRVFVNLKFTDSRYESGSKEETDSAQKMEDHFHSCMKEMEPYLRGPDGEFLSVALARDNPNITAAPSYGIQIVKKGLRSDSGHWKVDLECGHVLHETLHVLGLVDEYREFNMGFDVTKNGKITYRDSSSSTIQWTSPDRYLDDCRKSGPDDSIMRNEEAAESAVHPQRGSFFGLFADRPPQRSSILYPNEFRAIVYPGCRSQISLFYICSSGAYATSHQAFGRGCPRDLPPGCYDKRWVGEL